jgi:hypothetical protein
MHLVLHEFVCIMNLVLKNQLKWPKGTDFIEFMDEFKDMCISIIHGAIDILQIHVQNLKV